MDLPSIVNIKEVFFKLNREILLNSISLEVPPKSVVLVLGSNGSGKSTLLRCIVGLLRPSSGSIAVSTKRIGFCGHSNMFYSALTLKENLHFFARIRGESVASLESKMETWNLTKFKNKEVSQLSQGVAARGSLCRAFIEFNTLLVLDEPTASLDDVSVALLREEIIKLKECCNGAVLIATHDIARLAEVASHVVIINQGHIEKPGISADVKGMIDVYYTLNR
jgi:ABC-type multidrug transport system ATPase subunit